MVNRKEIVLLILIQLIGGTLLITNACCSVSVQSFDEIGVEEGIQYIWTLSDVNEDLCEKSYGSYSSYVRDGKQIIYNIEDVTENHPGVWQIEYECWYLDDEDDEDGSDSFHVIDHDYMDYIDNLDELTSGESFNPGELSFWFFFIPLKVEDFLKQIDTNWTGDGSIKHDSTQLTWTQGKLKAILEYDNDGKLNTLELQYNKESAYVLELTNSGIIPWLTYDALSLLLWISIPSVSATVVVILLLMKRSKHKKFYS